MISNLHQNGRILQWNYVQRKHSKTFLNRKNLVKIVFNTIKLPKNTFKIASNFNLQSEFEIDVSEKKLQLLHMKLRWKSLSFRFSSFLFFSRKSNYFSVLIAYCCIYIWSSRQSYIIPILKIRIHYVYKGMKYVRKITCIMLLIYIGNQ